MNSKEGPGGVLGASAGYGYGEELGDPQGRRRNLFVTLCVSLPMLSLAFKAIAWLRFGVDLPIWDDWRGYQFQGVGSFDLNYLLYASNDTLSPIGYALDSIAQRLFGGNAVVYQFLSMLIVLGLLLFLQWRLLNIALKDRLLAALAFGLTLMMLQPGSYWGLQSLAYHHAIPLVCNLSAICIAVSANWDERLKTSILFVLGMLSGLTYISGAFSTLAVGASLFILGCFIHPSERKPLIYGGLAMAAAGLITALPQTWVIVFHQKGMHIPGRAMALPTEIDYWLFMFGIISRSLMLPKALPIFSLAATVLAMLACVALMLRFACRLMGGEPKRIKDAVTGIVLVAAFAGIFAYLLLVAAGRTNLRPAGMDTALEIFTSGRGRFHFFWVTLLWPWVAAAGFEALRIDSSHLRVSSATTAAVVLVLFVPMTVYNFKTTDFRRSMKARAAGIQCINSELQKGGKRIYCPQIYPANLYEAIVYARSMNSSFMNAVHFLPAPVGTDNPPPLYRWSKSGRKDGESGSMADARPGRGGIGIRAGTDPPFLIRTGSAELMRQCMVLQVSAVIRAAESDAAQLFYKTPDKAGFKPLLPDWPLTPGEREEASFEVSSPIGFSDELKLDSVKNIQQLDITEVEVRCRLLRTGIQDFNSDDPKRAGE